MIKFVYPGIEFAKLVAGEELTAGQAVKIVDGKAYASDGVTVFGFVNVDVLPVLEDGAYRPIVKRDTRVGELVGVYINGGVYETDQFVEGTYESNADLYVTTEGKLTSVKADTDASATEGLVKVGQVIEKKDSTLVFKSLI